MTDDPIPVTCPACGYQATWIMSESHFAPALDMYRRCVELIPFLKDHPEQREKFGDNPRLCRAMRDEWVKVLKSKMREQ
jgi:hypothetical protein